MMSGRGKDGDRDRTYGVFAADQHESAGRAAAMGVFVGSSWAAVAILAWAACASIASGGADGSARIAASWVLACLAGGVLQQLWFNFRPTSRLGYGRRVAGFGVTYFVVLAGCAALGQWLPVGQPFAWAGFAGLYLVILAILTVVFTVAFRRRRAEYQDALDRFHQGRG